jgi:lipopolysaccharide transport system ATP-binding protein
MNPVIQVDNLSKKFLISHGEREGYSSLRDVIARRVRRTFGGTKGIRGQSDKEAFWALQDIEFDVKQGDRIGIIGRNGAGKSTLLKILSRIVEPTVGRISIEGTIASLLEVGTGFHPELTGRENIFLNGAILGMNRQEIRRKFDDIVDFSGVEKFLDTPVKRYSSGMYVRLAFAVAANLDPQILIVDEVLAVGDAEFQKKCLGKLEDASVKEGKTVLFVSHNLQAISTLTNRVILLNSGRKVFDGDTAGGIKKYLEFMSSPDLVFVQKPSELKPVVSRVEVRTSDVNNVHAFGAPFTVEFEVTSPVAIPSAVFSFQILNSALVKVQHVLIKDTETSFCKGAGVHKFRCSFPSLRLYPDTYTLILHLSDHISRTKYETIEGICPFEVQIRGEVREYYWKPGEAVYVDEARWHLNG